MLFELRAAFGRLPQIAAIAMVFHRAFLELDIESLKIIVMLCWVGLFVPLLRAA
jgi:hypothetical protein